MKTLVKRTVTWKGSAGFTLVELMVTTGILGILAAIAIPTLSTYVARAQCAAMKITLNYIMDGQNMYFTQKNSFFPERGVISVPKGVAKAIPEIAYSFPRGHLNSYQIYGYNYSSRSWNYNYCYIYVQADFDANNNGAKDVFLMLTYYDNERLVYNRELYQLS